jgi:hypothetical protein
LKTRSVAMFLIDDLETIFNTEFVDIFVVYLYTRFHMPKSNDLLAIAIRPKACCFMLYNTYIVTCIARQRRDKHLA